MRISLRDDQVTTLLQVLDYVIGRHDWALGKRLVSITRIDELAHKIARERVVELREHVANKTESKGTPECTKSE